MEFTEEVETVLPAGYTIGKSKKSSSRRPDSSSSSRTTEKTVGSSSSKGGLFSRGRGISKKFSKIRQYARSRSRSLSRERFNTAREKFNTKKRQLTKSTTPKKKTTSSPSPESNATQKETSTAASKTITDDRRDTEEAPSSSEPTREGNPAPPTDCSLTVGSADSQPTVSDNDDSTIIDTTSLYGRITGVLSPKKSNNEEVKVEGAATTPVESLFSAAAALVRGQSGVSVSSKKKDTSGKGSISSEEDVKSKAATPVESLPFATVALVKGQSGVSVSSKKKDTSGKGSIISEEDVKSEPSKQDTEAATSVESLPFAAVALGRGQSGVSVSSKKSTSSKRSIRSKKSVKSEPAKQGTEEEATPAQDEIIEQAQEEEAVVAKPEKEPAAAGHTWAKNISLKVGGFQTSFQMVDPVATITGKVNEAMNGFDDSELVKQAEALEYKDEERDYDENPTKLFLLLQQKAWGLAMAQLEKHPEEAEVWVYRKFVPEKAPNVHDASDPDKSQALVKQTTALSTVVNAPVKYRWRLLPLHASIVLGAPQEVTTKILQTYPEAARKVDERGSLPVHLAASRLDVDQEGEKVVLQLFGVYADSIDITDRRGRTAPELAKLARARKAAEKQRLMETASRASRTSRACIETSASKNWREEEEETDDDDDDDRSVKSSFSTRFRNMMKGSKSMDRGDRKKSKRGDLENVKSNGDDDSIVADIEGMAPGFAFLTVAKSTEERDAQTIANEVSKVQSKQLISEEYKTSEEGLTEVPTDALELPLPASKSFGDGSVKSTKSVGSVKSTKSGGSVKSTKSGGSVKFKSSESSKSSEAEGDASVAPMAALADDCTVSDDSSVVSTVVESIAASTDPQAALRALLEKACENAGRQGLDVTKFLVVLEEEWVTDVEAIRRLDGATLDSILPIMLSREVQRLVNHSNNVDGEYLKRTRGRSHGRKNKPSKFSKKKSKKRSARRKPAPRLNLDPIHEEDNNDGTDNTPIIEEEEEEDETTHNSGSVALTEGEDNTVTDNTDDDESVPSFTSASCNVKGFVDEDLMRKNHAALILEARHRFPTREALEDAIRERQATVSLAVGSGFDVDKQTLAQAALADDEVRKLLPLRLVLPSVADLKEMAGVLQAHKETALRSFDVEKALRIQIEVDEIQTQIDEEEKYLRRKSFSQTSCTKCGANFETKKKMVGILKQKEMVCDNCRDMPEV